MKINRRQEKFQIPFVIMMLIFLPLSFAYGQDRHFKTLEIIRVLELVENQRLEMITFKLKPLMHQVSGTDSIKLKEIERQLTDEEILNRIVSVFDQFFLDDEINDIYHFVLSSSFDKFFKSGQIFESISLKFQDIYDTLDSISESLYTHEIYNRKFEPFPIDRENGFYETITYNSTLDYPDIPLKSVPAITPKDIVEIEKTFREYGDEGPEIMLALTAEGAKKFYLLTKENIGKPIAIVINNMVVSMPTVQSEITGGKVSIAGNFTEQEIDSMIESLIKAQKD